MTVSARRGHERVVIVGAGFAGHHAARTLARLAGHAVEVILINPTDHFLYLPLLPEVTAGILEPRRVAVPLVGTCPSVRPLLGTVEAVDIAAHQLTYLAPNGAYQSLGYDRLVLAVGSVNKLLPIPGIAEYAYGFRSMAEAVYLRDALLRDIELAEATDDPAERTARCTFVVVGATTPGRRSPRTASCSRMRPRCAVRAWRASRFAGYWSTSPPAHCRNSTNGCQRRHTRS